MALITSRKNLNQTGLYLEAKTALTGSNLDININSLSGLFTGYTGTLDAAYASDSQLFNTGSSLNDKITSLSGSLNSSGSNLNNSITSLSGLFTGYTGALDATFASDTQLYTTGSTLDNKINSLSGNLTSTYATITNLANTGSTLDNKIGSLSGNLTSTYATITNLASTGSTLDNKIGSLSGYSASAANLAFTGSTLNNRINNLSGYINSPASNIVFTTGNQTISGIKSFAQDTTFGDSAQGDFLVISGNQFTVYGSGNFTSGLFVNGNSVLTGVNLSSYATIANLALTGSTLDNKIGSLSGNLTSTYATITNLASTGSTLDNKIGSLSGNLTSTYATITNLASTGSTLDNKIGSLSGYINTQDTTISNNLITTGSTLDNKINSLSGVSVLTYGNQIVAGTKYFNEDVYIHNLYVTGDEFIANVTNNYIESPYILLNLTGGATDGGIFFVTGAGFTGVNDLGPIIGFDHSNKFKFGVARRSDDLSSLPDIASAQELRTYSGIANTTFSTISNLALTGSTLDNKIGSLSGNLTSTYATITNLASTGSTLDNKISSLSGNLTSTYATITNLASTGSALDNKIGSLSGNLTSTYATITNLASTGSTLDIKINNLSGVSVLTFGDQTINGIKTFANGSNQILNTTYSTLTGLKAISGLLSGQLYRISDFVLKWNNQSYNDQTVKTAASGEPLIVAALSNKQIYHIAQSEIYPQDTIYYNIDASASYSWGTINNNASIPDFKGWIYRRVDNLLNIDIPYDWRNITVNCCKPDVSSVPNYSGNYQYTRLDYVKETGNNSNRGKLYYSVVTGNSGNALYNTNFWSPVSDFVESGTFFSTDENYGFRAFFDDANLGDFIINLPALTSSRIQQPTFTSTLTALGTFTLNNVKNIKIEDGYSNVIIGNNFNFNTIGNNFSSNTIGNSFYYNTIGNNFSYNTIGNSFSSNTIGNSFSSNTIGSYFDSNTIGNNFNSNTISNNFSSNTIGNNFNSNTIGNGFYSNTIGSSFYSNAIGNGFNSNTIGNSFYYNTIGNSFYYNTIGNNFGYNTIGNDFSSNTIGNSFNYNTIGNSFSYNTIGNSFSSNTIGNNFNYNTSEDNINGIDFSTSTHVYNSYNTTLFQNSANSMRLRYFNSSDQLVVTDPTA